ncbi:hypothetical protein Q2K19_15335 [Micromonospora soli]|uniref:hypothetical protein n=1 Tax=Micromonospora sp. NBRC 110009 TaxID=3061627 RepID=UPI00267220B2|nr:hypothetical protein [Micromonospora sp. NBRC 110009]WKU01743.1 hypothetical protein Q2K19_15335 [Micromonospora sp. NBRC 110009]
MGDRLLGLVAPRATASADDCGAYYQYRCYNGYYQKRKCCNVGGGCYRWETLYYGC